MRPTAHLAMLAVAMASALDNHAPSTGEGTISLNGVPDRFVGPPLRSDSGGMSAAEVARMSQRRSRQRASGKRR